MRNFILLKLDLCVRVFVCLSGLYWSIREIDKTIENALYPFICGVQQESKKF